MSQTQGNSGSEAAQIEGHFGSFEGGEADPSHDQGQIPGAQPASHGDVGHEVAHPRQLGASRAETPEIRSWASTTLNVTPISLA